MISLIISTVKKSSSKAKLFTYPTITRAFVFCLTLLVITASNIFSARPAKSFWFFCDMCDAFDSGVETDNKREEFLEGITDGTTSDEDIAKGNEEFQKGVKESGEKIGDVIKNTPGTSFTGRPNVKKLIKGAIKEAIKEVIGQTSTSSQEGLPSENNNLLNIRSLQENLSIQPNNLLNTNPFNLPRGEFIGTPVYDIIPVLDFDEDAISISDLSYLSPIDYDGSAGIPPNNFISDYSPMIIMTGSFTNIEVDPFQIEVIDRNTGQVNLETYDLSSFSNDLELMPDFMNQGFSSGIATEEFIQEIIDENPTWDPSNNLNTKVDQISLFSITDVDIENGTVSGEFMSMTGSDQCIPEPSTVLSLLTIGGIALGASKKKQS